MRGDNVQQTANQPFILFDLDGTLTDPKAGITRSVQYALLHFGVRVDNPDELIPFIGPPLRDSFIQYYGFSNDEAEQAVAKYREYFAEQGIFENELFDGMDALLRTLRQSGRTPAVATSKPTVYAERILRHFSIDDCFAFVAGSELSGARSQKSEVIRYALDHLPGASPDCALMVGDREYDILGARAAGLPSVGVLYGYGSLSELTAAGATHLAASVPALSVLLSPQA